MILVKSVLIYDVVISGELRLMDCIADESSRVVTRKRSKQSVFESKIQVSVVSAPKTEVFFNSGIDVLV